MKKYILLTLLLFTVIFTGYSQCPTITCPTNITVNNDPGNCSAVVNYTAPVGTDPCSTGGSITFNYTGSIVNWTVPAGVTSARIEVRGAEGGTHASSATTAGLGAIMIGDFALTPGNVLKILVGENNQAGNGGGGGSYVTTNTNVPMIIAGGGGGSGSGNDSPNKHGTVNNTGNTGSGGGGTGGTAGNGGNVPAGNPWFQSGAGGGLLTDGADGWAANTRGRAFVNGGAGGAIGWGIGGFGGGGNGSMYVVGGGGGGYSGGGSGSNIISPGGVGGGGGSFNSGTNQANTGGANSGHGQVIITYGGAVTTTQTAGLPSGATYPVGTTTNTFVVSNGVQTATCSFNVTVIDAENPVINCPTNITVNNDPGMCSAVVNYTTPVGTDNCPGVSTALTTGLASGSTFPVGTTTITYTATDGSNNTGSCTFTVTVNDTEAPTITCPSNVTSCNPLVNGIAPTFSDNCPGATVTYTLAGATTGNGNNDASGTNFNVGVTTVTYTVTDANGNTNNCSFTVTINPIPTMTAPANITVCNGDLIPASNFVSNPTGATFSWTNSNTAVGLAASGTGNTPAFNATNTGTTPITSTITVTPTLNGCVGNPVTYTITVNPTPPAPTAAGVTICPNNTATLTATAPGGNYEWFDAPTAGNLLGTGASYTTPVLTNNTTYYVQTTVNGCVSPRTAVTVTIAPALVVNAGVDDTICDGTPYTLGVNPNGPGYTYVWDELPAPLNFSNIFNPVVSPNTTTTYVVTITDMNNCVGSDSVTIFVNPIPTVTVPLNDTVCNGDNIPASSFTSTPAGATFNWTNSDPTIGLAAAGTGNTPAFVATNMGTTPVTATITVTPTANGCTGNPVTYTITVNPTPTMVTPSNDTVCNGATVPVTTLNSTPTGGTFSWTNSDPTIGLAAAGTGNIPSFTATNTSTTPVTATITITPTVNGCAGTPVTYTITVNPTPTMTIPPNDTVCNGDPIAASNFTSLPAGGTFSWTNSDPTIGLAAAGTGNTPTFNATNATTTPITATITVTPTVNGCAGTPITYTITVNPGATAIVSPNISLCSGDPVPASNYTSLPTGGTFSWTNSNPTIGLAATGTGNTPAFNAINTGNTPVVATISVVATANSCPGPPATYTITVNPITTGSTNVAICQGDSILIGGSYYSTPGSYIDTISNSYGCDSILSYNLTINPVTVENNQIIICDGDSVLLNGNYYSTAGTYPFTFTSTSGCDSIVIYEVVIDPLPTISIIIDNNMIYLGESANLTAYTGQPNTTYSWSPPDDLSCIFCPNPIATPSQSGWYYVTATNQNGCSSIDSVYIEVDPTTNIYVPNIFSPNDDGNNDVYKVRGKGIEIFHLAIYNRWGQLVFESNDINDGWNGNKGNQILNQGVFVYKLNVTFRGGKEFNQTGNITLVR